MKKFIITQEGIMHNVTMEIRINANSVEEAYQKYLKGEFDETEVDNGDFEPDNELDFEDFCNQVEE